MTVLRCAIPPSSAKECISKWTTRLPNHRSGQRAASWRVHDKRVKGVKHCGQLCGLRVYRLALPSTWRRIHHVGGCPVEQGLGGSLLRLASLHRHPLQLLPSTSVWHCNCCRSKLPIPLLHSVPTLREVAVTAPQHAFAVRAGAATRVVGGGILVNTFQTESEANISRTASQR